ncbi:Cof-type HAD-IIB family hydrolase [Virgibacillus soli]|uniref:Cof-type HAD-IIB family hydrolase n=1 Tax=Paracerasibacillus soli TaxID=480284 RepID=A0ABU5CND2_9BACI|nr:Cof-type HAD-IIB family hydrolase [Virgibacillus soli]MDY0407869.1 Cof-type HAD-IIB family hydrolase [Virgibacillus soli]
MRKKQHLIALDLDGTLLTDDKEISENNRRTIEHAIHDGHIVVIATGRPHRSSINYYHEMKLNTPMVNFNGALIHHPKDSTWRTTHSPMPNKTALEIVDACYEVSVKNIMAEVQDHMFVDQYDEGIIKTFMKNSIELPYTVGDLKRKLLEDPTSLLIQPNEDFSQLRTHLNDYAEIIEHRVWGAPLNIIEVVKNGINKAVGLQKIAKYYDIPRERIIAFGDEDNDLEMIDYAGVGVAMRNGIQELQSIANHITETNEADGVGKFLQTYLSMDIHVEK